MTEPAMQSAPVSTSVAVTASQDGNFVCMTFSTKGEPVSIAIPGIVGKRLTYRRTGEGQARH